MTPPKQRSRLPCRSNAGTRQPDELLGIRWTQDEAPRVTPLDMRATIDLPEPVFQILQARAEQRSLSIQAVILEAIEKGIERRPAPAGSAGHVTLPLIRSSRPGSLHSLTNAEIDGLLKLTPSASPT